MTIEKKIIWLKYSDDSNFFFNKKFVQVLWGVDLIKTVAKIKR